MLEVKDVQVMVKEQLVYLRFQGVDYVSSINDFYAALRVFLVQGQCKPFDLYLLERAGQRR